MSDFSFKKRERLSSSKSISLLFKEGKSISSYPVRILYNLEGEDIPVKVAISVPKRLYKRAVDRNLLKRRIREAYRLNKTEFYSKIQEKNLHVHVVFQYQHRQIVDFHIIEAGVVKGMEKVLRLLEN
jgi:ribonuclease P protein component